MNYTNAHSPYDLQSNGGYTAFLPGSHRLSVPAVSPSLHGMGCHISSDGGVAETGSSQNVIGRGFGDRVGVVQTPWMQMLQIQSPL